MNESHGPKQLKPLECVGVVHLHEVLMAHSNQTSRLGYFRKLHEAIPPVKTRPKKDPSNGLYCTQRNPL